MRSVIILALLIAVAFCAFGFLATFEPMDANRQWTWRIKWGLAGLACLGWLVWEARRK